MGFRINTNIAAMNAHRNSTNTNIALDKSLQSLSSGLRINTAADDASGLAIANSLRSQATGLGQAISNANDGIGVMQTADGALDEYQNIINIVRTKAIQSASDGQNNDSRAAIQRDIAKLLEEADNIASTTSFNGQKLLNGNFTDRNFQIGAYANETVSISIGSARIIETGNLTIASAGAITAAGVEDTLLINGTAINSFTTSATTSDGANVVAGAINDETATTGVSAVARNNVTSGPVAGGATADGDIIINGIAIDAAAIGVGDSSGALVAAINSSTSKTNVSASLNNQNQLVLTGVDGANIHLTENNGGLAKAGLVAGENYGTTVLSGASVSIAGATGASGLDVATSITKTLSDVDVTSYLGAQEAIQIADMALKEIDAVRSNIGSTQNQLESTIRNISVTQVNVSAAESQIRDVDFAAESANFSKYNILAQSGSYAMSQANAVQQNVMKLLQ